MSDDLPAVISGTRRQIRELADGTLEIKIHIDPRFKADFHRLFPAIDTPVAIAPLALDFERIEEKQEDRRVGPLCRLACIWCRDEQFREWLGKETGFETHTEDEASDVLRDWLEIDSRLQLDQDPRAEKRFLDMVRTPFMDWMKTQ